MHALLIFSLSSADSVPGRIDKASLSQQTLMELVIAGITDSAGYRETICGPPESVRDISEWGGLSFSASGEVSEVNWTLYDLEGSLDFSWFPSSIRTLFLSFNYLTGSLDLTCLPDGLVELNISNNNHEGTISLTKLPPNLKALDISRNHNLCGHTDFTKIPKSLCFLNISYTKLEGTIFLGKGS